MIINPWWFYLISVVSNLGILFVIILAILLVVGFVITVEAKTSKDLPYKIYFAAIFTTILLVLVPEEETCYQMMAASLLTEDNIKYVTESGKDFVDYIVESVDIILEEESEDEE